MSHTPEHTLTNRHTCCHKLEAYDNLNPAGYRACVEALHLTRQRLAQLGLIEQNPLFLAVVNALTLAETQP